MKAKSRSFVRSFGILLLIAGLFCCCIDSIVLTQGCSDLLTKVTGDQRLKVKSGIDQTAGFVAGKKVEIIPVKLAIPSYARYFLIAGGCLALFFSLDGNRAQ